MAARKAHNLEVGGSNPPPATIRRRFEQSSRGSSWQAILYYGIASLDGTNGLEIKPRLEIEDFMRENGMYVLRVYP